MDVASEKGQVMLYETNVSGLPAYIFTNRIRDEQFFPEIQTLLTDYGGGYYFHPPSIKAGRYFDLPGADDDPSLGDENAPLTLIEFSDFQCPFCKKFHDKILPEIRRDFIDTGLVRLVYRDFPLMEYPTHSMAERAAEAAECAHEQGKFWEYHDKIFEKPRQITDSILKIYVNELDLDAYEFELCTTSRKYRGEVQKDFDDGKNFISGTPTIFINDLSISGSHPYETYKQVIESELSKIP